MLGAKDAAAETQAAMATIRIMMAGQAPVSALEKSSGSLVSRGLRGQETCTFPCPLTTLTYQVTRGLYGLSGSCDSWKVWSHRAWGRRRTQRRCAP